MCLPPVLPSCGLTRGDIFDPLQVVRFASSVLQSKQEQGRFEHFVHAKRNPRFFVFQNSPGLSVEISTSHRRLFLSEETSFPLSAFYGSKYVHKLR